jgi:hypothetical protein
MSRSVSAPAKVHHRSATATRTGEDGTRDEVAFIGPSGARLFTCIHRPNGKAHGAVVICSPLFSEHVANYRREVLLGRRLAAMGVAAMRFHYRGAGHSDGGTGGLNIGRMSEDALTALEYLDERVSPDRYAFVGARLGAFPAVVLARRAVGAPVVLWEPVVEGSAYVRELSRIRRMHIGAPSEGPDGSAASSNAIEVLGYDVGRDLMASLAGESLIRHVVEPGALLLVQMQADGLLRPAYRDFLHLVEANGLTAEVRTIEARPTWWFAGAQWFDAASTEANEQIVIDSADWILTRLG